MDMRNPRARISIRAPLSPILSIFLSLFCLGAANGACLLTDYSLNAEFRRSDAVLVGSVLSERNVPGDDKADTPGGTVYVVKVSEPLRGSLGKTVEIFSENSSGRFPMKIGTSYLLFLYRRQGALSADYCGNSGPVAEKADALHKARALARHGPSQQRPLVTD
jgi:hypothetical protein